MYWAILVLSAVVLFAGVKIGASLRLIALSVEGLRGEKVTMRWNSETEAYDEQAGSGIEQLAFDVRQIRFDIGRIEQHLKGSSPS